tara:strand:- start:28 stop:219 length:192 start_codon:yes stop_codon:yes gene_type:complete
MTESNIANKSGYEIRAGLLQMAQRIVEQNAHAKLQQTKEWNEVTAEQITDVAEKLNVFVQKKD